MLIRRITISSVLMLSVSGITDVSVDLCTSVCLEPDADTQITTHTHGKVMKGLTMDVG